MIHKSQRKKTNTPNEENDLLRNPENFLSLILLPQLDDPWTRVDLARGSDGSWEVYLHVKLEGEYNSRLEAEEVAAYYQENLTAYRRQASDRSKVWRSISSAVQSILSVRK